MQNLQQVQRTQLLVNQNLDTTVQKSSRRCYVAVECIICIAINFRNELNLTTSNFQTTGWSSSWKLKSSFYGRSVYHIQMKSNSRLKYCESWSAKVEVRKLKSYTHFERRWQQRVFLQLFFLSPKWRLNSTCLSPILMLTTFFVTCNHFDPQLN